MTYKKIIFGFNDKTLPKSEWTHEAHLVVGLWHAFSYSNLKALNLMREKIKAYNETTGTENSENSGYHETITRFWLVISRHFIEQNPDITDFEELCNQFLLSKWTSRQLALEYYSQKRLFSVRGRLNWLEPDVITFPIIKDRDIFFEMHEALDDQTIMESLGACTLHPAIFTHEAHLRVAYILIKNHTLTEAKAKMNKLLINFTKFLGVEDKFDQILTERSVEVMGKMILSSKTADFKEFIIENQELKNNFLEVIQPK